jgi:hypothetical protein
MTSNYITLPMAAGQTPVTFGLTKNYITSRLKLLTSEKQFHFNSDRKIKKKIKKVRKLVDADFDREYRRDGRVNVGIARNVSTVPTQADARCSTPLHQRATCTARPCRIDAQQLASLLYADTTDRTDAAQPNREMQADRKKRATRLVQTTDRFTWPSCKL